MRGSTGFHLRTTIALTALVATASACGSESPAKGTAAAATAGTGASTGGSAGTESVGAGAGTTSGASAGGNGPVVPGMSVAGLTLQSGDTPTARLHRLTSSELRNSLLDLLGEGIPLKDGDPNSIVDGFASIGSRVVAVSPAGVGSYEAAMRAATDYVFADPARISARLACVPQNAADATCLAKAISSFGRKAFRRPLSEAEVTRYSSLASSIAGQTGNSALSGLRSALSAILQSPSFLYRVELGVASAADGGKLKYTDYEMASRLAATLWDSVPDDALLDAAGAGMLATPDGVKAQAARLLADPKAHRAVRAFADELFGMSHLAEAIKDPALFPQWSDAIKPALQQELELRIEDMVFTQKGDFLSLYDDRKSFVNADLAKYYGLPAPAGDGFQPVTFPADSPRVGLLGAGAILAGHALPQRTSPTQRGKFVAESLLCRYVPPPPDNVPPLPAMPAPGQTLRQRLEAHRASPACSSCHALMDPMGFGMEDFDSAGQFRTVDGGSAVDPTGTLTGEGLDGSSFSGLAELGAALRKQPILGPCLVSKLYAEAQGRSALELDRPSIDALAAGFASSQNHLDQLIVALVTSDSFRFVEPSKG